MAETFKEIGNTGLAEFIGQIHEDFLRELRGAEGYKRYNEMRLNSPVIGALLLAIEQSVRGAKCEYTSDDGEDDPRLELLNESREAMTHSWNDHVSEALTFLPFGFAPFEVVYQRVGGKILWRKFAIRSQDTVRQWKMDDNGGMVALVQQAAPNYKWIEIPIEKLVIYRTRVEKNNPEGRSILRTAWIPYYFCKHIQQIEAIGIERDLAGLPHIELPPNADATDTDDESKDVGKAKKLVRNIRNDQQAGVVTPAGWIFKLVSTGGSRAFDTDKIIRRYETRMLMSALAQFLMLGQDGVGSLALSNDQSDFFTMSVNSVCDTLAETHEKYAVARLLALNGYDAEGIHVTHSPAGDTDIDVLSGFLQKVGSMITWTADDEVWLRGVVKLPERTAEEIAAEKEARKPKMAEGGLPMADSKSQMAEGELLMAKPNVVERLIMQLQKTTDRIFNA